MEMESANDGRWPRIRARATTGATILLGISLVFLVFSYAGQLWWGFELLSHFRAQYVAAFGLLAVLLLALRAHRPASLAAAAAALQLVALLPAYGAAPEAVPDVPTVRVLFLNLNSANRQHDAVTAHLEHEDADFVVLAEAHHRWMGTIDALAARKYPHQLVEPHSDNFGIAFLSKHPIDARIENVGGAAAPCIIAEIASHNLTLIGAHPWPPVSAETAAMRDEQVAGLARLAREATGHVVLVGDLNMTPWSPMFDALLETGNLRDSRRGFGIDTTWPTHMLTAFRIPIDHALTSPDVVVTDRRVGPDVGSDHLSVTVDVALR